MNCYHYLFDFDFDEIKNSYKKSILYMEKLNKS